jgi:NCAIR mutase (PurE)-related protein
MSLSEAAKAVAEMLGVAKARAYDVGLALKKAAGS